jgi:hypothetical protein
MSVEWYWPDWESTDYYTGLASRGDPDYEQSRTACCPRETIPDSCSCPDGCQCACFDCDCGEEEETT